MGRNLPLALAELPPRSHAARHGGASPSLRALAGRTGVASLNRLGTFVFFPVAVAIGALGWQLEVRACRPRLPGVCAWR
jgi:hypothetical protein